MTLSGAYTRLRHPVEFVTATDQPSSTSGNNYYTRSHAPNSLSGEDARAIYESVLSDPSTPKEKTPRKRTVKHKVTSIAKKRKLLQTETKVHILRNQSIPTKPANATLDFFRAAENGNMPVVQQMVENQFVDIDAVDQFKWTSLMMSAHNGHMNVVQYLLVNGANWRHSVDASGYDAYDLANLGGHSDIAHLLYHSKSFVKSQVLHQAANHAYKAVKAEKLWCEVCDCQYSATKDGDESVNPHQSSVLHQFAEQQRHGHPNSTHFFISTRNRGYQLLRSGGWDGKSGLGPDRSGQKYPVKTVLKRNRHGLGSDLSDRTPRVTHFAPGDKAAVMRKVPTKDEMPPPKPSNLEKERTMEIDFRRLFH